MRSLFNMLIANEQVNDAIHQTIFFLKQPIDELVAEDFDPIVLNFLLICRLAIYVAEQSYNFIYGQPAAAAAAPPQPGMGVGVGVGMHHAANARHPMAGG